MGKIFGEEVTRRAETARASVAAISARKRRTRLLMEAIRDAGGTVHAPHRKNLFHLEEKARELGVEVKD